MRDYELVVQRKNTDAYLDADGESVTLSRSGVMVSDGAGGFKPGSAAGPVPPQTFVLATTDRQLPVRRTVDGLEISPEYIMTGAYDADVQPGDWFYRNGLKYEVVFVHLDRNFQTTAEVIYRG